MRLNYPRISKEGFQGFGAVKDYIHHGGLEESLIHIIYLRVSQINGCSYCVDVHWRDAIKIGEDARKLNALTIWRDTPFFSVRERAALAWAESVTLCEKEAQSQPTYDEALQHFSEKELVDLTFAIALMNAYNRIGISMHSTPAA